MGVFANIERAGVAHLTSVVDDGLSGREDVVFVERAVDGGSAMPRGAERDLLIGVVGIWGDVVIAVEDMLHINEVTRVGGTTSTRMHFSLRKR